LALQYAKCIGLHCNAVVAVNLLALGITHSIGIPSTTKNEPIHLLMGDFPSPLRVLHQTKVYRVQA
jgi:hypothetical protein